MTGFTLDPRLKADTVELGTLNGQLLLLMNNALLPWFILVPVTTHREVFQLDDNEQARLYRNINMLSRHLLEHHAVSKINSGAIGNIVSQLHIHVIGRHESDYAWPGVVWGRAEKTTYANEQLSTIIQMLDDDDNIDGFSCAECL